MDEKHKMFKSISYISSTKCIEPFQSRFIASKYSYCTRSSEVDAKTKIKNLLQDVPQESLNVQSPKHSTFVNFNENEASPEEMLKILQMEYYLLKEEGIQKVPSSISEKQWKELIKLSSPIARAKYFRYLFLSEMAAANDKKKKAAKRAHSAKRHEEISESLKTEGHIQYGLWRNSIMMKRDPSYMNKVSNKKLFNAKLYGQPLIFDFGFEDHMTNHEKKDLTRQLLICFTKNRRHIDPFDLKFCNFDMNGECSEYLQNGIPGLHSNSFPHDIYTESYLEKFPKEKLVYLTPHCKQARLLVFDTFFRVFLWLIIIFD